MWSSTSVFLGCFRFRADLGSCQAADPAKATSWSASTGWWSFGLQRIEVEGDADVERTIFSITESFIRRETLCVSEAEGNCVVLVPRAIGISNLMPAVNNTTGAPDAIAASSHGLILDRYIANVPRLAFLAMLATLADREQDVCVLCVC